MFLFLKRKTYVERKISGKFVTSFLEKNQSCFLKISAHMSIAD